MDNKIRCDYEGCDCGSKPSKQKDKKVLVISWQRLIEGGDTCPRCGSTEAELDQAVEVLKTALAPLGIEVLFEKSELTLEEFKQDPLMSNRILFNGCLLEELIDAKTGQSQCCDVCGDDKCRTVEIVGETLESIPAELIVKAGLRAAASLIG